MDLLEVWESCSQEGKYGAVDYLVYFAGGWAISAAGVLCMLSRNWWRREAVSLLLQMQPLPGPCTPSHRVRQMFVSWCSKMSMEAGGEKMFMHFLASGPNSPPPKPSWPPTLIQRASMCSEFKQLSACTDLMPNNAIPDELQGKKLVCVHSCTDHLFSAQIQPKPLPKHFFTSICNLCIMQCLNCKFGINCW
jgi:hypothetical protein